MKILEFGVHIPGLIIVLIVLFRQYVYTEMNYVVYSVLCYYLMGIYLALIIYMLIYMWRYAKI
jgi:hypothetical protein